MKKGKNEQNDEFVEKELMISLVTCFCIVFISFFPFVKTTLAKYSPVKFVIFLPNSCLDFSISPFFPAYQK